MSDSTIKTDAMIATQPGYEKMPSWPYFIWIIFLSMIFVTILLWVLSMLFNAPLEEAAEWAKTPNPAKAPWYFIGLQELLVYFDPWIAGVLIPQQIIIGLMLIPYVDTAPSVQGCYNYSKRKFQFLFFSSGIFLWFFLIVIGQFLRGPSWEMYWPLIDYPLGGHEWVYPGQPLKTSQAKLYSLSLPVGLTLSAIFFSVGMALPVLIFKKYFKQLGIIKYSLVAIHVLLTLGVVGKILLRLVLGIKYVIVTPWFNI
ncbi:MAG: hypothetical protein HY097_09450 [Nitrospinae bacterium]|nr:hypothetical protein [Nitrospinota bacterium]MBI3814307.1 hypothetical protein [Nitrospinota bacterium]